MTAGELLEQIKDTNEDFMQMFCGDCSIDGCCDLQEDEEISDPYCYKSGKYKKLIQRLEDFIEELDRE